MSGIGVSYAALPDEVTYNFTIGHYTLSKDDTDCSYYANPKTLEVNGGDRSVTD